MSYPNTTNKETFSGNGSNQAFAYSQNTALNADVKVSILSTEGVPTELTHVTHYDLTGVGGSGGITVTYPRTSTAPIVPFDVPLSASEKIVVQLDPAHDQQFDKKHSAGLSPGEFEAKFDKHMRLIQTLFEASGRSFKVALGTPDPDDTLDSSLTGSRTLLASESVSVASLIQLYSEDWPATYDIVELEFIGIRGSSGAAMEIQPLDTAAPVTANMEVNILTHIGSRIAGADNADWATSGTYTLGTGADDWLTGNARFHHYNNGYLNGIGDYNYRDGAVHYGAKCYYARHTAALTRLDGFNILMSSGNISGLARMFGIRKT